jgi:hypothetical protein
MIHEKIHAKPLESAYYIVSAGCYFYSCVTHEEVDLGGLVNLEIIELEKSQNWNTSQILAPKTRAGKYSTQWPKVTQKAANSYQKR